MAKTILQAHSERSKIEEEIKEWTGLGFGDSMRTAEDIEKCGKVFLAYQTRFTAIFTSADKSYLRPTYLYPTRGIDKKRIITRVVNTLVVKEVM